MSKIRDEGLAHQSEREKLMRNFISTGINIFLIYLFVVDGNKQSAVTQLRVILWQKNSLFRMNTINGSKERTRSL